MSRQTQTTSGILPDTLIGRLIAIFIAAGLAVVGLFFVAFALMAAAVVAVIVIGRIWWIGRKLRAQRDMDVIEGSFSVEAEQLQPVRSDSTNDNVPPSSVK